MSTKEESVKGQEGKFEGFKAVGSIIPVLPSQFKVHLGIVCTILHLVFFLVDLHFYLKSLMFKNEALYHYCKLENSVIYHRQKIIEKIQ